jgi:tRNA (mo5U34)-methyltransferase
MKFHHRVANAIAQDGFVGVWNRVASKWVKSESQEALKEYTRLVKEFHEKTLDMDFRGLGRFLWYHTVDLGNGIVTPGNYDYRKDLDKFLFPEDMSDMHILDIGSATGFFSFEFEKRGAAVTSVELPTIADWDMPSGENKEKTLRELMEFHKAKSVEDLHYLHLDGPFLFCREMLNSNVKRCYSTIYDLCLEKLNNQQFDLVFIGDVLLHLFSPLKALSSVAPLCRGKLIISQRIPERTGVQPVMLYMGGDARQGDNRTWWLPNKTCFAQMLKRVGFRTVEFVGRFHTIHRPHGYYGTRTVIHAIK